MDLKSGSQNSNIEAVAFCENDPAAQVVLSARFPHAELFSDIAAMDELPPCDLVASGFPCQDLSQAGNLAGIGGERSGLVMHVFRLLRSANYCPTWIIFENVPFLLNLNGGAAIARLIDELERLGMRWAYRIVDSQAFGLAQRRRRLFLLASRTEDPAKVLFADDAMPAPTEFGGSQPCGFYWTEGNAGLGWAVDAVPPLKGTSGVGIVSPPGLWFPNRHAFGVPAIEAAEELQGFSAGWTSPAAELPRGNRARLETDW